MPVNLVTVFLEHCHSIGVNRLKNYPGQPMILSLTSLRKECDLQHFFCTVDDIESGLEVLSFVALQGDTVLEAHLTDEQGRLNLPTEVFDGQPFRAPIRRLEKQWKKILTKPLGKGSVHTLELMACTRRLITLQQAQLKQYSDYIARLTDLQQRVQYRLTNSVTQSNLMERYQVIIDDYSARIDQINLGLQHSKRTITRLSR